MNLVLMMMSFIFFIIYPQLILVTQLNVPRYELNYTKCQITKIIIIWVLFITNSYIYVVYHKLSIEICIFM